MKQIFVENNVPYALRSGKAILAPKPKTTGYGIENARFLGSTMWHAMLSSIKESRSLESFKGKTKNYDFACNCRLCKFYANNVGFLILVVVFRLYTFFCNCRFFFI